MFLSRLELVEVFPGVWQLAAPLVFASPALVGEPGLLVPAGYRTRFERIPPPARKWVLPESPATAPALLYSHRREHHGWHESMILFQTALRVNGVARLRRLIFGLSR